MLNLVLGRNYADKTEYVRNLIAEGVKAGDSGFIIIVPEQFSYATEKGMLEKTGTSGMLNIEVLSFSRLAELVLEASGKNDIRPPVDDGVRMLTMSLALESIGDRLNIFKKYVARPQLTESLVSFATEMKQFSVTPDMLADFASASEPSSLKSKLDELVEILNVYNSMLEKSYFDTNDSLSILADTLNEYRFFEGKTVVIDEFTRFTKQELSVVEKILVQSKAVYITYDTDYDTADDEFSLFTNINGQIKKVVKTAKDNGVEVNAPILLEENTVNVNSALALLEKHFYVPQKNPSEQSADGSITVCSAPNAADECNFVAMTIKKLMRKENVRCRDIVVYQRSKDSYDKELAAAFERYGVPFYEDKRQPVNLQPLIVYIRSLLNLACRGITTELLMRWLKTGLTTLQEEEICELENYAFIWRLKTSQWKNDFTEHPDGFGAELDDFAKNRLNKLNELRKKAVVPILSFKKAFDQAEGEQKTAVLYDFLIQNKVNIKLKELAADFSEEGRQYIYDEQNAVWELVTDMLDKLYRVTENRKVTGKRYLELFEILLSAVSLGELPQGLDSVTFATADRSRAGIKDYVFILGANEGLFPLRPSTQGLINDKDRITLRNAGIELASTAEYKSIEEEYIAYRAVCSARKKLYVSFCGTDLQGNTMSPSGIVSEILGVFPETKILRYSEIDPVEKIESDASAFEVLSGSVKENPELFVTLEDYFKDKAVYSGRVETIKNVLNRQPKQIKDKQLATELFGKNMYFSASKAENYHKCPFQFFCRYGINAQPRKEAQIDPSLSGTIIHNVFEHMLSKYSKQELEAMSDESLKAEVDGILKKYLNEKMGGEQAKTQRFLKQYALIGERVLSILKRIIEEFKTCDFKPVDFELSIGRDGDIKPYMLTLDDGGTLKISGSVDRVDTMEKDGKKYLRVIDYKSNGKEFHLSDVFSGLSMQMLIYLFAIYANGKEKYGDFVPSGIFYMSAKPEKADLPRNATQEQIDKKRLYSKENKLNGMVVDDITAIQGMEKDLQGLFIPAYVDKNGELKGNIIPLEKLFKLNEKIDEILKDTAMSLHGGIINAKPDSQKTCDYCDYKNICGFESGDDMLEIESMSFDEALEAIDGENNTEAEEGGELNG